LKTKKIVFLFSTEETCQMRSVACPLVASRGAHVATLLWASAAELLPDVSCEVYAI
jgi:hypothetical protein